MFWRKLSEGTCRLPPSLDNGITRNRAVGIHVSEFRPENEILGRIKFPTPNPTFRLRDTKGKNNAHTTLKAQYLFYDKK